MFDYQLKTLIVRTREYMFLLMELIRWLVELQWVLQHCNTILHGCLVCMFVANVCVCE